MQKQLKVSINGKQYSIATDQCDEDIYDAATLVDTLIKSKVGKAPVGSEERVATIVALQLATDLAKNQKLLQSCEQKLEQLLVLFNQDA